MKLKLLLFSLLSFSLAAQENLYNLENSKKFADYLLKSGQFNGAVNEYERVLFMAPQDSSSLLELMRAYRLSQRAGEGIVRAESYFEIPATMPKPFAVEYSKLLLNAKEWPKATHFWEKSVLLPNDDKIYFNSTVHLFNGDFQKASSSLEGLQNASTPLALAYKDISMRGVNGPYKSPFLAGFLSTAIPGLGKVYTGDWKDAIVSLIFTGGMAFQAYRNFSNRGINNYRPWVYSAVGLGFYLGNIAGSVKSAKDKNRLKVNRLQHEASDLFNSYY